MPIELFTLILFTLGVCCIVSLLVKISEYKPDYRIPFCLGILMGLMTIWGLSSYQQSKIERETFTVHTIDNINICIIDNNIYNLNEKFHRSFKDGSQIILKRTKAYTKKGLYYSSGTWKVDTDATNTLNFNTNV